MPVAVIFDVDGTLIDSVGEHAQAWQDAFGEFGHAIPLDEIRSQIGKGGDQLLPVFLPEDEIDAVGEPLEARRSAILKERYLARIEGFPKVRELVRHLLDRGHRIALASSAKEEELATYKEIAGIDDLIDTQTSSDAAEKSKPHPDIFEAAMAELGHPAPADAIVIGDTPYDATAAAKAGLRAIGLSCGGWPADELRRAGCIAVYADPAELLERYAASPLARREA